MRSFSSTPIFLAAATLVLTALAPLAHAQSTYTFYPEDTTVDSALTTDYAIVGYAGGSYDASGNPQFVSPSLPTVNFGSGADLSATELDIFNQSSVNIYGGNQPGISTHDNSKLNVYGGTQSFFVGFDHSAVNLAGGSFDFMLLFDYTQVNMSGGYVSDLEGQAQSVTISGGTVDQLVANAQSSGLTGDILGSSIVDVSGGDIGQASAYNLGILNVRGGIYADRIIAAFGGTVNVYGTDLSATLLDPNFTGIGSSYSRYALSGTLGDGSVLTNHDLLIRNDQPGDGSVGPSSFNLISTATAPEPGSRALLWTGLLPVAAVFLQRRRGPV